MRRRIAHGLAVFLCVASLGAAQGNSGSALDQSSLVRPQPKPATKSKLSKKAKPYQVGTGVLVRKLFPWQGNRQR